MNENEPVKKSEFLFRRVEEQSFSQFMTDLWSSTPLWLLIPVVLIVAARVGWAYYYRSTHPHAKKDPATFWLGWASIAAVGVLVSWVLVAFYIADSARTESGAASLTALSSSNQTMWYTFAGVVFGLGVVFVVLMYVRDSKSVRWFWASKLAVLRITVYAVLCFVFLLPARQTWERTEKRSRVVVLIDISPSVTRVSDDVSAKGKSQKKRMEALVEFLTDKDVALVQKLLKDNPVAVYPFGTRLDETPQIIERNGTAWNAADWQAFAAYDFRPFMLKGLSEADAQALKQTASPVEWAGPKPTPGVDKVEPNNWAEWAGKWVEHRSGWAQRKKKVDDANQGKPENERKPFDERLVNGMTPEGNAKLSENIEKLERRIEVARSIALGTNVADSVTAAVNRESPNMTQGIIVFSDMRSNLGSEASYRDLRDRATKENIPLFMIAVGEDRQNSSITITDVQADDVMSPDEGGRISVEADGTNLAGKSVPVLLDVWLPGKDPKTQEPDYTFEDSRPDKTKGAAAPYLLTFNPGEPPHGSVEFIVNPEKLAADPDPRARGLVTESTTGAFKKPVLREGKWNVRARIPKDENEAFAEDFHTRERPGGIQVLQKKLRVLVIAGAPTREFQFIRTFLTREAQENRAAVTLLVQNEAGTAVGPDGTGLLTPNPGEQIIVRWPTKLDLSGNTKDPKEKPYNLNEYDLILAIDPDWTEVSQQQADDLKLWVERQGGGFILVADRINTYQLARVERAGGDGASTRLLPVLEILPVLPDDHIAVRIRSIPKTPRRLYLNPLPGSDLLRIDDPPEPEKKDEKPEAKDPVAGWERFFTDRDKYVESKDEKVEYFPRRGFFSCYPVKEVKPGAWVLAEFAEVDERGQPSRRPWLVVSKPDANFRTAYMGSGEIYRMYAYDKEYYERYWAKLMKYMAAKRNVKASRGRVLVSKEVISGQPIRVQAQILNTGSKPYPEGAIDPKFTVVQVPLNGDKPKTFGPYKLIPSGAEGYYKGQETADPKEFPPGEFDYLVQVEVPDSPGDVLSAKFNVVKSDLEMDVKTPDFAAWLRMASDYDVAFQNRITSADVKKKFADSLPKDGNMPKLAFKLGDRELIKLIPECFGPKVDPKDVRGPVDDLWDKGVPDTLERLESETAHNLAAKYREIVHPSFWGLSWVMILVVTLLCWEWLTRKLLRLA